MDIELRPGIPLPASSLTTGIEVPNPKGGPAKTKLHFFRSKITELKSENNNLQFAVPGGLIGVGTNIDPSRCRGDKLLGQTLGLPDYLPQVFSVIEIKYDLNASILGTAANDDEAQEVLPLSEGEMLLANIGSHSDTATVTKVKDKVCRLELLNPVCASKGERITLSRKIAKRWRLIGNGEITRGKKLK